MGTNKAEGGVMFKLWTAQEKETLAKEAETWANKGYTEAKIFASKGLGKNYINTSNKRENEYRKNNTNETYRLNNGAKTALPIYYRNKIYNEEEREYLWIEKLDKNVRYIGKSKFDMNNEEERKQPF